MKTVAFKFNVGDHVLNPFGTETIITMCAIDDGGIKYYVMTSDGGNWFKEDEIIRKDEGNDFQG